MNLCGVHVCISNDGFGINGNMCVHVCVCVCIVRIIVAKYHKTVLDTSDKYHMYIAYNKLCFTYN